MGVDVAPSRALRRALWFGHFARERLNFARYALPTVRRATTSEFKKDPVGRYVSGANWAHFCAQPKVWGMMLWGRPTEADAQQLERTLVLELAAPAVPHVSIVDASRLEAADEGAFTSIGRYVENHWDGLRRNVTRLALVRPDSLLGAVVAGAFEVMRKPYPVKVFPTVKASLRWLGAKGLSLDGVYAEATGHSPVLGSLRAWLDGHLEGPPISEAARFLELSQRTLQRRLTAEDTSYERELMSARVRTAQRLLGSRDAKLSTIAVDAGFASLQQLNAVFKRVTGTSPRAWRESQRG